VTAYAYGAVVTHVMEWNGDRHHWAALCRVPLVVDPRGFVVEWPVEHDPTRRQLPFCKWCCRIVQRRVDRLTTEILQPARAEGTLP